MPKCSNDETKSYTGNEPSPKGLGFSASAEEVDKIMIGKDGANWIVTQTKTCKKWVKVKNEKKSESKTDSESNIEPKSKSKTKFKKKDINFNELDEDCYTYSYIPDVDENELTDENGCEEKFGGSKPFFIEGESWPLCKLITDEECMMLLLCQFKDPRKEDNILIRVFCNFYHYNVLDVYKPVVKILPIELTEENLKKQVLLEPPKPPYESVKPLKSYKIKSWNKSKELKPLSFILNKYDVKYKYAHMMNVGRYIYSNYSPCSETKIGGTRNYCTSVGGYNSDPENFLQLTECEYLDLYWGELGIAHINEDGELDYDYIS